MGVEIGHPARKDGAGNFRGPARAHFERRDVDDPRSQFTRPTSSRPRTPPRSGAVASRVARRGNKQRPPPASGYRRKSVNSVAAWPGLPHCCDVAG